MNRAPFGKATATDEAAHWHLRQREGALGAAEQQRFMDWLVASPEHLREYLAVARVVADLGEVLRDLPADADSEALIAGTRPQDGNVVALAAGRRPAPPAANARRPLAWPRLAAAAVLVLGLAATLPFAWPDGRQFAAPHGQPRVIALDDGTVMHLNAQSRATVSLGWWRRHVELAEGQASFVVAEDRRPFTVHVAGLEVRDIGTTFDVSLQRGQARFGVVEGRIHVLDRGDEGALLADLGPGQSARVALADHRVSVVDEDPGAMTAWWQRRIVFRDEPLHDIADRFNRMNAVRLRVDDSAAGALRLTGNLQADDLASLRAFLDEQPTLVTTTHAREIRVRSRHAPPSGAY